jgi:hypothetical protein
MQAIGLKNRISLHSIDGSNLKIRGSLSFGTGGHFRKSAEGSLSFGISSNSPNSIEKRETALEPFPFQLIFVISSEVCFHHLLPSLVNQYMYGFIVLQSL